MSSTEFKDIIDVKSLLQANSVILAGSLIFLTLVGESFNLPVSVFFITGTYCIIGSMIFCLVSHSKNNKITERKVIEGRKLLFLSGNFLLFFAITFHILSPLLF